MKQIMKTEKRKIPSQSISAAGVTHLDGGRGRQESIVFYRDWSWQYHYQLSFFPQHQYVCSWWGLRLILVLSAFIIPPASSIHQHLCSWLLPFYAVSRRDDELAAKELLDVTLLETLKLITVFFLANLFPNYSYILTKHRIQNILQRGMRIES